MPLSVLTPSPYSPLRRMVNKVSPRAMPRAWLLSVLGSVCPTVNRPVAAMAQTAPAPCRKFLRFCFIVVLLMCSWMVPTLLGTEWSAIIHHAGLRGSYGKNPGTVLNLGCED